MMIPKATKEERERIEKELMEIPGMLPPTGGKDARVYEPPIKLPGEPLSQTIIKARRC